MKHYLFGFTTGIGFMVGLNWGLYHYLKYISEHMPDDYFNGGLDGEGGEADGEGAPGSDWNSTEAW